MLLLLTTALASPSALSGQFLFPVPTNAMAPEHGVLQPSVAEQDYFWVDEKYPASSALAHYRKVLSNWLECSGPSTDWSSYGDLSKDDERFVHARSAYWVSGDNDAAVVFLAKYESKGISWRNKPDNDNQFVAVVEYRVPNAREFLADLKVSCAPGT
jgi:hypothetical protein